MSAFCAACDETNYSVEGIKPVQASAPVLSFFGEHSDNLSLGDNSPACLLINSVEEFEKIAPPSVELPAIDFDKYTLVVGQWLYGNSAEYLGSRTLIEGEDRVTMNLEVGIKEGEHTQEYVPRLSVFWGIYPKISAKHININIVK
jgi:hypothetical protein